MKIEEHNDRRVLIRLTRHEPLDLISKAAIMLQGYPYPSQTGEPEYYPPLTFYPEV